MKLKDPLVAEVNDELAARYPESGVSILYEKVEETGEPEPGPSIWDVDLPAEVLGVLERRGIKRLYKFQYEAYKRILNGENTVISAGTGMGKTEAFLLPILKHISEHRGANPRAMILYPTKALARDQVNRFRDYLVYPAISFGIYDGDTPSRVRRRLALNPPSIIVSNPDMLHIGLVYSEHIRSFTERSSFMVFDELHVYEGVLGSHIHHLAERLKRTASRKPVFIGSSATISNPRELAEALFNESFTEVRGEAWRKGTAIHALISAGYLSRWSVTASLAHILSEKGLRFLVFVDSQQLAELLTRILRVRYGINVMVHRAGLPASIRRSIEAELREGRLEGVVATPTLELGIDIGVLDAVVMASPPPSYAKYLQRAGRAGRRGKGYVFTILGEDPIDAYYARDPDRFFKQDIPPVVIEPFNEEVSKVHLLAYILQAGRARAGDLPEAWRRVLGELKAMNLVREVNGYVKPMRYHARRLLNEKGGLRAVGPVVSVVEAGVGSVIATRELPIALLELYPRAIYLYMGEPYIVESVDLSSSKATVRKVEADAGYYTRPLYTVDIVEYEVLSERLTLHGTRIAYARVLLELSVEGVVFKDMYSGEIISTEYLTEPVKYRYSTRAVLLKYPVFRELGLKGNAEAFHAVEHALISAARLTCGAGLTDLGGISYPSGDIVVYDSTIGGSGISKLLYERFERAEDLALEIMSKCSCEDGCPRCVYSPYCGNNNQVLSRRKAVYVLSKIRRGVTAAGRPLEEREGKPIA